MLDGEGNRTRGFRDGDEDMRGGMGMWTCCALLVAATVIVLICTVLPG